MPTSWRKNFTQIDNVNNGNEFELNDYPLLDGFNVPLNNTQWLYNRLESITTTIIASLSSINVLSISDYKNIKNLDNTALRNTKIELTKSDDSINILKYYKKVVVDDGEYSTIYFHFKNDIDDNITIIYDERSDEYTSTYEYTGLLEIGVNSQDSRYSNTITKLGLYAVVYSSNTGKQTALVNVYTLGENIYSTQTTLQVYYDSNLRVIRGTSLISVKLVSRY